MITIRLCREVILKHLPLMLLTLLIFGSTPQAVAQSGKSVSGIIVDENKEPVIGATIIVDGTSVGAISDVSGKFTITAHADDVLVVTYIGYQTEEVTVGTKTSLNIALRQEAKELQEIVVVGYGEQTKASLVGAVASVQGDDIERTSSSDVLNALTGRAAGVRIAQYSSEPGTFDTNIDIRGMGEPLIIIDGSERSQEEFSRLSSFEIESVSVLKDASAAIYGVKAANGVVLVTTKKGEKQKAKVSYTGRFGVQAVTQFMEQVSALQYGEMYNEKELNTKIRARTYFQYEDEIWDSLTYDADFFSKCLSGEISTYDYIDMVMNNVAAQQQHAVSVSGGTDNTTYFINLGYYNEQGLYASGSLNSDKINTRFNITTTLAPGLNFNMNVGYINTTRNAPSSSLSNIFKSAISYPVTDEPYVNGDTDYLSVSKWNIPNPLATSDSDISGYEKDDDRFLQSTFALNYRNPRLKELLLTARFSYDYINKDEEIFSKAYDLYSYDQDAQDYRSYTYNGPSEISQSVTKQIRYNAQLSANYNKKWGNHKLGALLLFEARDVQNDYFYGSTELAIDENPILSAGLSDTDKITSTYSHTSKLSAVSRINYDYDSRYLLEASCRLDGSSKFPVNNRWGLFPSILTAWRFSEESFIRNALWNMSNGKLRVSYGILGDDAAASADYESGYTYPSGNYVGGNVNSVTQGGYYFGNSWVTGLGVNDVANENLTWYTSKTFNIGLDLGFFGSKYYGEFDYFTRERSGLLGYSDNSDPGYVGANLPQENLNGDITSGFEIVLGHRGTAGEVTYNVSGNVSYTRTKWTDYEESDQATSNDDWRYSLSGRYTDVVWGYKTDGVYTTFEEIAEAPLMDSNGNRTILPGTYKYIDQNGDGVIDSDDMVPLGAGGTNKPLVYFGLNVDLQFRGFDFSMLWQGAAKNLVRYTEATLMSPFAFSYATPLVEMYDRWHCINYDDPYNSASWEAGTFPAVGTATSIDGGYADVQYFDASYVRLKSIELGYTFTEEALRKVRFSKCRVYVNAFNPLTFSSGYSFLDPEYNSGRNYSYPVTYSVNIGVDLTF